MPEQQPDDLVEKLADILYDNHDEDVDYIRMARAVLARTDLVLPAADVIPKQAVLDLADKWEANGTDCGCCRAYTRCAHGLRALVAGGES